MQNLWLDIKFPIYYCYISLDQGSNASPVNRDIFEAYASINKTKLYGTRKINNSNTSRIRLG